MLQQVNCLCFCFFCFDVRFLSRRGIARGIQPRLELGIRKAHRGRGRPEVVCVVAIFGSLTGTRAPFPRSPKGRDASRALPEITTGHSRPTQDSGHTDIKQHKAPGPGFTEPPPHSHGTWQVARAGIYIPVLPGNRDVGCWVFIYTSRAHFSRSLCRST